MYDGLARSSGKYRSLLERQWAGFFRLVGLHAEYVDQHWHDFIVEGEYVVSSGIINQQVTLTAPVGTVVIR